MSTPADTLITELVRRGVRVRAENGLLRYRPASAVPPELVKLIKAHKPELLAVLHAAQGDGPAWSAAERRLMQGASAELWGAVNRVKAGLGGAEVVRVESPRQHLAELIRDARRNGDHDRALNLREAWQERAGIMEHDGEQTRTQAEAHAVADTIRVAYGDAPIDI